MAILWFVVATAWGQYGTVTGQTNALTAGAVFKYDASQTKVANYYRHISGIECSLKGRASYRSLKVMETSLRVFLDFHDNFYPPLHRHSGRVWAKGKVTRATKLYVDHFDCPTKATGIAARDLTVGDTFEEIGDYHRLDQNQMGRVNVRMESGPHKGQEGWIVETDTSIQPEIPNASFLHPFFYDPDPHGKSYYLGIPAAPNPDQAKRAPLFLKQK